MLNDCSYVKPLTTVDVTVAQAKVNSKRPKLDSHVDTYLAGNISLVVYDKNMQGNV